MLEYMESNEQCPDDDAPTFGPGDRDAYVAWVRSLTAEQLLEETMKGAL
jgi:hypothetical protein